MSTVFAECKRCGTILKKCSSCNKIMCPDCDRLPEHNLMCPSCGYGVLNVFNKDRSDMETIKKSRANKDCEVF